MKPKFYRTKEEAAKTFVEQACDKGPNLRASSAELLVAYDAWCQERWDSGEQCGYRLHVIGLGRALVAIGIPNSKTRGKTFFRGIAPR